jgi:outer membrane receptor protein involved in Fe transport
MDERFLGKDNSSTVTQDIPFRVPVIIPETTIDGSEFESTWLATSHFTLGMSLGYLDAAATYGNRTPLTPKWSASLQA